MMINLMLNRINTRKYSVAGKLILLLAGVYGFIPASSYADVQCDISSPGDIRINPVTIYNSDPVTTERQLYARGSRMNCTFTPQQEKMGKLIFELDPAAASNTTYPDAFNTNLAGVGLKFAITGNPACAIEDITKIACNIKLKNQQVHFVILRLFFKTDLQQEFGTINIPQGNIKYYLEQDGPATAKDLPGILGAATGVINKNGCTLKTPNLDFDLGKHQQNSFKGIGSTGREITQPIILSCNPKTKYFLSVNGDDAGALGVIKLSQALGMASGIGVQLLTAKDNQPIILTATKEMGTSAIGSKDSEQTIGITARYYQTDTTITPGIANASATFTMTYE